MLTPLPPTECTRAHAAASSCLDGELSELGRARLELHLRDCAACRAYADELGAIAAALRTAPLERPRLPVDVPRRRLAGLVRGHAAAVAAVGLIAAVAGSSFAVGRSLGGEERKPLATATGVPDADARRADWTEQHVLAMLNGVERPHIPGASRVIPL